MSAVAVAAAPPGVVPQLARSEARRLLCHPVMLVGFALWVGVTFDALLDDITVVPAFDMVTTSTSFFPGVPAVLAAHMVTTRDLRAGTVELLASAPVRVEARVRALLLAAFVPAAATMALNVALTFTLLLRDEFAQVPSVWHLAQGPLTVLGACMLGTMIGVWAPSPVAPVVSMVALVAGHVVIAERGSAYLFGPAVFWSDWGIYDGSVWVGLLPGSVAWHQAYVVGLCGLAAAGALLRVAVRRGPVVALGLASLAITAVAGVLQLP